MIHEEKQESAFKVFGFISEQARRNFIIFVIMMLILSNIFFVYQSIILNNRIQENNQKHNEMMLELSSKITEEVRKQIQPTHNRILQTTEKIDEIADKMKTPN